LWFIPFEGSPPPTGGGGGLGSSCVNRSVPLTYPSSIGPPLESLRLGFYLFPPKAAVKGHLPFVDGSCRCMFPCIPYKPLSSRSVGGRPLLFLEFGASLRSLRFDESDTTFPVPTPFSVGFFASPPTPNLFSRGKSFRSLYFDLGNPLFSRWSEIFLLFTLCRSFPILRPKSFNVCAAFGISCGSLFSFSRGVFLLEMTLNSFAVRNQMSRMRFFFYVTISNTLARTEVPPLFQSEYHLRISFFVSDGAFFLSNPQPP